MRRDIHSPDRISPVEAISAIASDSTIASRTDNSDRFGFQGDTPLQTLLRSRRAGIREPAEPFDIPDDDRPLGLRRCGDTLIGVLAVAPTAPAPLVQGTAPPHDSRLLAAVTAALATRDAAPSSIDIVSHTMGCWGTSPAARAYRGLLGGLRLAAHRSVHLVVRIRPSDWPEAVLARGGDGAGSLRTALWCLRRTRARLNDCGLATRALSAVEITDLTARLTEGVPMTSALEGPIGLEHRGAPLVAYTLRDPDPETISALLASPVADHAVSTTVTLTVSPGPTLRVIVRDNGGRAADRSGELGLELVRTPSLPAAAAGLPIGPPPQRRGRSNDDAVGSIRLAPNDAVSLPLAGDGQIVGADVRGNPVTLRLAGRDVPRCDVIGDGTLHRQVVARLAALGFAVAVASDRPERWRPLADAAGPGLVTVGPPRHRVHAIVDDTAAGLPPQPGATLIHMSEPTSAPQTVSGPVLRQSPAGTSTVASGSGRSVTLRLVSTPAEQAIVGR